MCSPWAARKLVRWSAHLRYTDPERASVRAEELAALIEKRPGNLFKLITATLFAVTAIRVAATRRVEEISLFRVDSSSRGTLAIVASSTRLLVAGAAIATFAIWAGSRIVPFEVDPVPTVGSYSMSTDLARTTQIQYLENKIVSESGGTAYFVSSAIYENGRGRNIIEFSGGNWKGASAASFMSGFQSMFEGAFIVRPGSGDGREACVDSRTLTGDFAECVWVDKFTFGVFASPTMSALRLAQELGDFRAQLEQLA